MQSLRVVEAEAEAAAALAAAGLAAQRPVPVEGQAAAVVARVAHRLAPVVGPAPGRQAARKPR